MPRKHPRTPATPEPEEGTDGPEDPLRLEIEGLRYALDRLPTRARKVQVAISLASGDGGPPLRDLLNLYPYMTRWRLAQLVADHFARQVGDIMGHLNVLLDQCERAREGEETAQVVLTEDRRKTAEKLLLAADLLDGAAQAITDLGYVGEEENKRLVYLVATSRLLAHPLSAILFAPSGTGKSDLLDKLVLLLPPEAVEFLSRLTPSALYYARDHLRHKVVVVDEQAGASEADYPIRTLQTKGLLRMATPVEGSTRNLEVHGPIALLSGTTNHALNPENLSRCLALTMDDSGEQTRRIQTAQRRACSGAKLRQVPVQPWQDAQRVLERGDVVIPFAERLEYPARATKDRRDNQKLLTLIKTHALLFQRQRERDDQGRVVATVADYRVIFQLVRRTVSAELDGLSSRAALLYRRLAESSCTHVTTREAMALLGSSYMSASRAIHELETQELLAAGRGKPRPYRVIDKSLLASVAALTPPEAL